MPRVVEDQLGKFRTDPMFKQLQDQSEIRYTGYYNCPMEERKIRFCSDCYEGSSKIIYERPKPKWIRIWGFLRNGVNLVLSFPKAPDSQYTSAEYVDFLREPGKVFLVSPLIFNGVCVKFYGWLEVERLRGFGCLIFDEKSAQIEDKYLRETSRRKQGAFESTSNRPFNDMYCTASEVVASRSSCIYDCRRITRARYSV